MTANIPQRPFWNNTPERLPDAFTMAKRRGERIFLATCEVWTHVFGWELRLMIDGQGLQTSNVVRSAGEMVSTIEKWQTIMRELGWS